MSAKFSLNREDAVSILKGLGIALAGAALTYFTEIITKMQFGAYTPIVVSLWSVLVNVLRKFLAGQTVKNA